MQTTGLALVFGAENVPLLLVFLDSYLGCSRGGGGRVGRGELAFVENETLGRQHLFIS